MATNLDPEFLADLAGLQGDLWEAGRWLEANWPADLPAPALRHGLERWGGDVVRFSVYTRSAEQMRRAAEVLGTEVTVSSTDDDGRVHEHTFRNFGRVAVRVAGIGLGVTERPALRREDFGPLLLDPDSPEINKAITEGYSPVAAMEAAERWAEAHGFEDDADECDEVPY